MDYARAWQINTNSPKHSPNFAFKEFTNLFAGKQIYTLIILLSGKKIPSHAGGVGGKKGKWLN